MKRVAYFVSYHCQTIEGNGVGRLRIVSDNRIETFEHVGAVEGEIKRITGSSQVVVLNWIELKKEDTTQ